ncbi:MAG: efflux RND transporter periplasmic adaptor subunit [Thiobacillus sp.]|nr:efflux RND transporter periplasmic adaptor subunit [Thiobacillus sp.]
MNRLFFKRLAAAAVLLALGAAGGLWWSARHATAPSTQPATQTEGAPTDERRVLYWYDPMVPAQHFDKPGKSPFMDMELVPKYADAGGDASSVKIDPAVAQNLGMRLAPVRRVAFADTVRASAIVAYNERDIAIVQARSGGYVERVARLAPGDTIGAGALIAELLVPQWAAAQQEYLALRETGDAGLVAAAESRMRLTGMPERLLREVVASGQVKDRVAMTSPIAGVVQTLDVRPGMTLAAGQTLARINGIATVWLDVAAPQAQAGEIRIGQTAQARFAAFPGETVSGRVVAVLPALDPAARTLTVRVELPNRGGRIRPGLSADVTLDGLSRMALALPTEAVIRSGTRARVLVASGEGRYRPAEITLGRESGELTEVLSGLAEGDQVVASGQFLIDSEASLQGLLSRLDAPQDQADATPLRQTDAVLLHEADAVIDSIDAEEATLTHGPFKTLAMPGMTMAFPLARPELGHGLKPGDRVRVGVRETGDGLVVEKLDKSGSAQ